ncbi:MAG TPA: hypothetical protein VM283_06395 [Armatimonadota bacterium]|nr:hypothetical protein [Armatimonadota bacterium]
MSSIMGTNGHHNLDWLDKALVYAALSAGQDPEQAALLLAREGLSLPPQSVAECQRQGQHKILRMRESGLAPALLGPGARHIRRLTRLDNLCAYLEARVQGESLPLDRELAALLQQYRELISLLFQQDGPSCAWAERNPAGQTADTVAATLTLLEALHDDELPPGDSTADLCDAARRLAAASGGAFSGTQPDQPDLAPDDADLSAAAGPAG